VSHRCYLQRPHVHMLAQAVAKYKYIHFLQVRQLRNANWSICSVTYVYIHVCKYIFVYVYICTYVHVRVRGLYKYIHMCIYIVHVLYVYIYICICIYVCIYTSIYIYIYICTFTCWCLYKCRQGWRPVHTYPCV